MGDYTPKLSKVAGDHLQPGERLIAGIRAMSKGSTGSIIAGITGATVGGAAGMVHASKATEKAAGEGREQSEDAGVGHAAQVAVGLTDQRVLVFKRSPLSGKAKELLGAVPLSDVDNISGADSGSKLKPDTLTVHLNGGSLLEFEAVKADDYNSVVQAYAQL